MALRPQSPPSLPALDAYTALFSTYINQQRDEVTASYQAKLAEVEAGLKAAQDEAASLRDSNSSHAAPTLLDLQQQLQAARNQVEARERAYKQVYEGSENLVAYYRSSNAESQQVAQREKQSVQAELDALRVEHQALQQDRLNERAAQGAAKREVESLKRKTAELEKSLTEAKSAEEFLKRVVLEMRNTDAGLVKQLENGKTEREKVETELRNRLEVVTSESAKHKAEAEEVSAKLEESMPHFRRLLQEIERLKQEGRESSSVITALQHQVNGASLASHQEVARLQDQLSVLRSQQSQSQAALTESVQKVEMYEQEVSKLREALTRAEATTQTVQADRDAAISRVEDLSLQLSAAQEEGTREKENLGNRMLLLASTLRHHDLAILDVDSHALAPSPKLVSLWEKLQELVSEFETPSSLHFPFVLTEYNNAVASIFSALVDQLARFGDRSQHRQEALDERELLEGKLETTADGLFTAISSPAPPCSVDESHNSQPESISESESESESQMLDTSTLPVASSKEGRKPVSVPPALSPESSTPSTTLMSDHPSSASPISVTDADETVIVAAPKSPRGRPKKPVVASKAAPSKSSTVSLVLPGIDLSSSSADTPEPIPATTGGVKRSREVQDAVKFDTRTKRLRTSMQGPPATPPASLSLASNQTAHPSLASTPIPSGSSASKAVSPSAGRYHPVEVPRARSLTSNQIAAPSMPSTPTPSGSSASTAVSPGARRHRQVEVVIMIPHRPKAKGKKTTMVPPSPPEDAQSIPAPLTLKKTTPSSSIDGHRRARSSLGLGELVSQSLSSVEGPPIPLSPTSTEATGSEPSNDITHGTNVM